MSRERSKKTDMLGIVSLGFFLVLIGAIFMTTPSLSDKIRLFFHDFQLEEVRPSVYFPIPKSSHQPLYNAVFQLCLAFAVFQVLILIARFGLREPINKKSETFSGLFFWFGAAAALNSLSTGGIEWLTFWGWIVVLIGAVIVVRSTISLCARAFREKS